MPMYNIIVQLVSVENDIPYLPIFQRLRALASYDFARRRDGLVMLYRVTQNVGQNLPLTLKQKFRFGLARPG